MFRVFFGKTRKILWFVLVPWYLVMSFRGTVVSNHEHDSFFADCTIAPPNIGGAQSMYQHQNRIHYVIRTPHSVTTLVSLILLFSLSTFVTKPQERAKIAKIATTTTTYMK